MLLKSTNASAPQALDGGRRILDALVFETRVSRIVLMPFCSAMIITMMVKLMTPDTTAAGGGAVGGYVLDDG